MLDIFIGKKNTLFFEGDGVDILKLFTFSRNNQLGF
jgi:hypothetical protein